MNHEKAKNNGQIDKLVSIINVENSQKDADARQAEVVKLYKAGEINRARYDREMEMLSYKQVALNKEHQRLTRTLNKAEGQPMPKKAPRLGMFATKRSYRRK